MLAGISILPAAGLVTTEAGDDATFTIRLDSEPTAPVTIDLSSNDTSEGIVLPESVIFELESWNLQQTVTVTGVDDELTDGDVSYIIETAAVSADPSYDEFDVPDVSLINRDNDSLDFGDAPISYTTLSADGARHLAIGPMLGTSRDVDTDGLPTAMADGDDTNGDDDEDGIVFGSTIMVGQLDATVTVNVQNAPDGAKLDAWIDFNGDGSFGGSSDQIADHVAVSQGDNILQFDIPSSAASGETYARFRLSTAGNLAPSGRAPGGEVEDYLVTIAPPAPAGGIFGPQRVIAVAADRAESVYAADLDGDGDLDVLSTSYSPYEWNSSQIAWSENIDGRGTFGPLQVIRDGLGWIAMVRAVDMDGDGDNDVLAADSHYIRWYENSDGLGTFGTSHTITGSVSFPRWVLAADVDGDGDMDVLSASRDDGKLAWYENIDGLGDFGRRFVISDYARLAGPIHAIDMDGDGDMDVLSSEMAWYENVDGLGTFDQQHIIAVQGASMAFPADLDSDGDIDVLGYVYRGKIVCYANIDGRGTFGPQEVITTAAGYAQSVYATDVDGDGDMDVLSASADDDNRIAWYENTDGRGTLGPTRIITTAVDRTYSVSTADVDGDGDLDVLSASWGDGVIAWYENDFADITVTPTSDLVTTEDGSQATFTIQLESLPTAPVTIDFNSSDPSEGVIWPANVTFTAADWHLPQTVTITGVDDDLADGDIHYIIETAVAANADPKYARLDVPDITVVNWDNTYDFGDAPAPYATLLADDGAYHVALGPSLGTKRDFDTDGLPTAAADGDDADGDDDEEGVRFDLAIMVGQLDAAVTVNVQNAPDGAKLDAWIDFNGDGSWGGPGEQIADGLAISQGDSVVEFDVPSWAASGETYARFRLSTAGNLAPAGRAVDGEIEDYLVTIESPYPATGRFSPQQVISDAAGTAKSVFAADVDGDGDMDAMSAFSSEIAWHENTDGLGTFGPQRVIDDTAEYAQSLFAADVDGDGDIDALVACYSRVIWYENTDGQGTFGPQRVIDDAITGVASAYPADVDGDGDLDVLSAAGSYDQGEIIWYENTDGLGTFGPQRVIDDVATLVRSVFAADLDSDGDMDMLFASWNDDNIAWYENTDGRGTFGRQQVITTDVDQPNSVYAADMDGDGDMDVLSASFRDDKIAWYENTGGWRRFGPQRVITVNANVAYSVVASDMDGDGDMDVLSASTSRIIWYENTDGLGEFGGHRVITSDALYPESVHAADIDGDGDMDVLSTSSGDTKIGWYENLGPGTEVGGRYVFYNNSGFDAGGGKKDDDAIALDKQALLPGETATAANYTSYSRGINGIMVDIAGLPEGIELSVDDFQFRTGSISDPQSWQPTAPPTEVDVRLDAGVGGCDRVSLIWTEGAVTNGWLEVTVDIADMAEPDVFYFANMVGDANGDGATDLSDFNLWNATKFTEVGLDAAADFDRSGAVDLSDFNIWNAHKFTSLATHANPVPPDAAGQGSNDPTDAINELAWLRELDQSRSKRSSGTSTLAAQAVDRLLATYWE